MRFPTSTPGQVGGRLLLATTLALVAVFVATVPVGASGFSPTKVLRTSSGDLGISPSGSEYDSIAAGWLEGSQYVVRWSNNGGATFGPRVNLGPTSSGAADVCGGFVAVVRWPGNRNMKLDLLSLDGRIAEHRFLATNRTLTYGATSGCVGDRRLATGWMQLIAGEWHVKVAFVPLFESLPRYEVDLGPSQQFEAFNVFATARAAWVTWERDATVFLKRFAVADDAAATVTAGPTIKVVDVPGGWSSPVVAAVGSRVYVVYGRQGDSVLQVSADGGLTFGAPQTLLHVEPGDLSGPISLDAKDNYVFVTLHDGPWGDVGSNWGLLSTDWGRHWTSTPVHTGGYQVGMLVGRGASTRVAELWDNRSLHSLEGQTSHIRFHIGMP